MSLQVVGDEGIVSVPIHVDESITKSGHGSQRVFKVDRTNASLYKDGECVGTIGWRTVSLRCDDVPRQVEAAFDGNDKVILGAGHLVGIRQELARRNRSQTAKFGDMAGQKA
jgi:hypothetical protein